MFRKKSPPPLLVRLEFPALIVKREGVWTSQSSGTGQTMNSLGKKERKEEKKEEKLGLPLIICVFGMTSFNAGGVKKIVRRGEADRYKEEAGF